MNASPNETQAISVQSLPLIEEALPGNGDAASYAERG